MKSAAPSPSIPNNLPLTLDAFVGRDDDLARLGELLGHHRLVTITGPPGMGKTRLAVEVARCVAGGFGDGVWLVALAPLGAPDLVAPAVASVTSAPAASKRGDYSNLVARVGEQRVLLVLDNCEHVLDACAHLTAALLEACPNLAIMATSQERLSVAGEHVWQLSGLTLPTSRSGVVLDRPGSPKRHQNGKAGDEPAASHAVQLFDQRARAASRRFILTADNVGAVVDICRRLDGIPLAIELAAARVGMFPPAEIAAHLDDRFAFLTGGKRSSLPRHQTLQAAVDWSYELLSEPEQALLRRLSVFAGGSHLDAIEQVCGGDGVDPTRCLDLITTLVARSLVVATEAAPASRFHLLETIRFYGKDRLAAAGEVTSTAARHVRWCTSLAEEAEPQLAGPTQQLWLARLTADHDNLRAAMAWSLDQGPTDNALRMAVALTMFWRITGHFAEGLAWLDRALAVSDDAPQQLRARAWWGTGLMAAMLGNYEAASYDARQSLALSEELDDRRGMGRALLLLGTSPQSDQGPTDDVAVLQQAIALSRQVGDSWCLALALATCGWIFAELGDAATARPVLEESIAVARSAGDEQCLRFGLISLGRVALLQGDYGTAEELLMQGLSLAAPSDSPYEAAVARTALSLVALGRGDHDLARSLLAEAAADSHRAVSGQVTLDLILANGQLALAAEDLDGAEAHFTVGQAEIRKSGGTSGPALLGLGEVALARGDAVGARALLGEALESARAGGHKRTTADTLCSLGNLARFEGDDVQALAQHERALMLRAEIGDLPGVTASFEAIAGLAARTGQADKAARVLGAARALRDANGYARAGLAQQSYEADVATVRDVLGVEGFEAALAAGALQPFDAIVSYLSKNRGSRAKRPVSGAAALTGAERKVANLAMQGLSNAQICEQLFLSINTVKSHLTRVFEKLSVSSRSQLISRFPDGF